ncbi:hypothetical protein FRX31_008917 [Thalictrum thalictroides]|uniref:Uncharacterized protein n=1 Tax=Thalictrum thalictroides TaxID=46969 RepID=A0A7J6WY39_THATH|nr:hypothetical protein FRX31_008917 [Thalictrum thalictroides]
MICPVIKETEGNMTIPRVVRPFNYNRGMVRDSMRKEVSFRIRKLCVPLSIRETSVQFTQNPFFLFLIPVSPSIKGANCFHVINATIVNTLHQVLHFPWMELITTYLFIRVSAGIEVT